jgi:CHASE2 domain-containing sensor protein/class 3 adenylate cyclase
MLLVGSRRGRGAGRVCMRMLKLSLTRSKRRLLARTFLLGALVTTAVVAAEAVGWLQPMENFVYDRRARWCQRFVTPPSTEIVHLNIDDQSLDAIGRWPWPRATLATLIDALNDAGAKVIALDMLLAEPSLPRWEPQGDAPTTRPVATGSFARVDDDEVLAAAMRRAGNVLLPTAIQPQEQTRRAPVAEAMLRLLRVDPELTSAELSEQLAAAGFAAGEIKSTLAVDFLKLHKQALFDRIEELVRLAPDAPREAILANVLPKAYRDALITDARKVAEQVFHRVTAYNRQMRFGSPIAPGTPPLVRSNVVEAVLPVPGLARASAMGGFVDHLQREDAVVRDVPLFADMNGLRVPSFPMAIACRVLGVDPRDVKVREDAVSLPLADGTGLDIPTHFVGSDRFGTVTAFMNLPWFGSRDWWAMYDYPSHRNSVQQEPMVNLWRVEQLRQSIAANQGKALDPILFFYQELLTTRDSAAIRRRWQAGDIRARAALIDEVVNDEEVLSFVKQVRDLPPGDLGNAEKLILSNYQLLKATSDARLPDLLDARRLELRRKFGGKIVLVGWSASGQMDFYQTPLHAQCPGVISHGVALNAILTRTFLKYVSPWTVGAITAVIGLAVTVMVALLAAYRAFLGTATLLVAYLLLNGFGLYDYSNYIVPAAGTIVAAGATWGLLTLYRFIAEAGERARITREFSSMADPAVVNYLVENPEADVEANKEMTVVFTDLAGFTTISEKLKEGTVPLLNEFFGRMLPLIRTHGGCWDKFLGDGIMFFLNGLPPNPNHATDAVTATLLMQRQVTTFNHWLRERELPAVGMRVGVSTGMMVVGRSGSLVQGYKAVNYTVLGDSVNLGARLESANKYIGSKILVTGRTVELMRPDEVLFRPIGRLQVVGKTEGVVVYEPLCMAADATDADRSLAEHTRRVYETFTAAKFDACVSAAEALRDACGPSKLVDIYLREATRWLDKPGDGSFDGTIVLADK